jgi:hypothetical protein
MPSEPGVHIYIKKKKEPKKKKIRNAEPGCEGKFSRMCLKRITTGG